jgi:hypothetical protein
VSSDITAAVGSDSDRPIVSRKECIEMITENKQIPGVNGLFVGPAHEAHLVVSKCKTCGTVSFPKSLVCRNPRCGKKMDVEESLLSRRGELISFTVVHYPPLPPYVAPDPFVPFPIGEVKFSEGIAVIGQMVECANEDLKIGMEVEVVLGKLFEDAKGNDVMGWKFRPVSKG